MLEKSIKLSEKRRILKKPTKHSELRLKMPKPQKSVKMRHLILSGIFNLIFVLLVSGCTTTIYKHFKRPEKLFTCQMDWPRKQGICGRTDSLEPLKRVPLAELDKSQMFTPKSFERLKTFMDLCRGKK